MITLATSAHQHILRSLPRILRTTAKMAKTPCSSFGFKTCVLPVDTSDLGRFKDPESLETWQLPPSLDKLAPLLEAAKHLKLNSIPVGFPTETVYGLGADATRSDAVKGIYQAKGRPSDNPLIIHVSDLTMLRSLLIPVEGQEDPIPQIYQPLIQRFWPGPLTILLPKPSPSKLAPEVTAGLPSFGARMPDSALAQSLIHLVGVPLAAPSANASTKPSPTTAQHVLHDLEGKIEIILDGGPCLVGVESTVVDGLCSPPVVLRPGGISIQHIRECKGWEDVEKGYKDASELGSAAPRAPGMKYKHYSPKATVILYEPYSHAKVRDGDNGSEGTGGFSIKNRILKHLSCQNLGHVPKIGIVSTKRWRDWAGLSQNSSRNPVLISGEKYITTENDFAVRQAGLDHASTQATVIWIALGTDTKAIAHGLFSALRELDEMGVDVIHVEGIDDSGDIGAAVMNRLRKAATIIE